ncbi:hypothetical protein [Carboxylicivirga sp. N1Y90]|uniref:hypothetical protein n=1 Tax=Carboxylicivirga fragile TaxID=3417571 RepID=UPI003D3305E1|nr:hypothetical protein [Marinilabiliaceae bacterium N1Y90]
MIAKFKIDERNEILYEIFYGDISLEDLEKIVTRQMQESEFKTISKTFSDIRQSRIIINSTQLDTYVLELKEFLKMTSLQWAILADDPHSTALSLIIKQDPFFQKKVDIFSTITGASIFLGVDLDEYSQSQDDFIQID